jgi:hypothetical protein
VLAAGQGRQRKGGAGGLCKGRAAARAGRSARLRQTARRAAGQGFGLGRAPASGKGRQRAAGAVLCVWPPSLGVFSLCDPAPARARRCAAIWSDQMKRAKSGSPTHLVGPDDRRSATSSQGAVSKSGPSQDRVRTESGPSQDRVRTESGRKLSNDFNESADCSQESGLESSARPPHPVAAAAPLLF